MTVHCKDIVAELTVEEIGCIRTALVDLRETSHTSLGHAIELYQHGRITQEKRNLKTINSVLEKIK